jgi:hypothetical protein
MADQNNKWSKTYWSDLGERVASVVVYGLITWLTLAGTTSLDVRQLWPAVALPALLSLLKGLGANLASPESGASALPSPPAPRVEPVAGPSFGTPAVGS